MVYILMFAACWIVFLFLVDKERFSELYPSALIGILMSLVSNVITPFFPLWHYNDDTIPLPRLAIELLDDFGAYPVIAFLYVQHMPATFRKWFFYTFAWTLAGIGMEYILILKGYMVHQLGWTLGWSYLADWVIFGLLTLHQLWYTSQRMRSTLILKSPGKVFVGFVEQIRPLPADHPLHLLPSLPGIDFYQSASSGNLETFLFILKGQSKVPEHQHEGYEIHYLVDGFVSMTVNGQETFLKQGDLYHFPSYQPHAIKNLGEAPAKIISLLLRDTHSALKKTAF